MSQILRIKEVVLVMPITVIQFRTLLAFLSVKLRGLGSRDDCSLRCFSAYLAVVGLSKKTAQILPVVRGHFRGFLISVS